MDEVWLRSFVQNSAQREESVPPRRRSSLLQPVDSITRSDLAANATISAVIEEPIARGPPKATLRTRASSWHKSRGAEEGSLAHNAAGRRSSLHPETSEALDSYSSGLYDDLLDASHEHYESYYEQLELSQNHLDALLASTTSSLKMLSSLSESFQVVEEQTNVFHRQCQNIMAEQRRLSSLADDVKENMQYYSYLEPITRRLNAPGASNVVTRQEFPEMLSNLDSCLDYMHGHPKQKEAAIYQARYRLLLTRALTLIRVHFTDTLRGLAADVSRRIADKEVSTTAQSALLYARFRATAPELRDLCLEILKRAVPPADAENEGEAEYQSLMNELYQSYSANRGRLILPIVARGMADLAAADAATKDLIAFARRSVGFIRGICFDEYELWCEWFVVDGGVYEFLEGMCEPLFDYLRPVTIRETRLSKLCELCTFLQTSVAESEDEDNDGGLPYSDGIHTRKLDFAAIIQPALADAQTRLVFLALAALRDDIENFRPKPEDLAYPSKARGLTSDKTNGKPEPVLSGRKTSAKNGTITPPLKTPTIVDQDEDMDGGYWAASLDRHQEAWYPTLPKAIRLLSRIYRLVNSSVFDDMAHRIVHSTTLSLVSAASQISQKVSPTDANLFLISHLLHLKQQIVAFDIEFVAPEITFDFSSLTNTFYELRERGGLWNPTSWYKLAATGLLPKVVENMLDAKAELDGRLRVVINEFVNSFSSRITAPLTEASNGGKKNNKGGALDPKRATTAVRGLAEKDILVLRQKVGQYIEDSRTRETLVMAVKDQVILAYEDWMESQPDGQKAATLSKLDRKGKAREDEVWSTDMFADWCDATFGSSIRDEQDESQDEDDDDQASLADLTP